MDRRKKCGTCRYFRDADIAGSGWCTHPQRGDLHDLVLVRKVELACRNSWDQDLWEPHSKQANGKTPPAPQRSNDPPVEIGIDQPATPAARLSGADKDGATDRVTEIAVPFERVRPPMPTTRRWTQPTGTQNDLDLPGLGSVAIAGEPKVANGTSDHGPLAASESSSERSKQPEDREELTSRGAWRMADPYEARMTMNVPAPPVPSSARHTDSRVVREAQPRGYQSHNLAAQPAPKYPVKPEGSGDEPVMQGTEPLPIEEINKALEHRVPAAPPMQAGITMPVDADQGLPLPEPPERVPNSYQDGKPPHVNVDGVELGSGVNAQFRPAAKQQVEDSLEPVDRVTWISGIPRCCATCRDFRRSPDGKTGVCTNSYAFLEQPVVQSDQLACEASGPWWLPHDEFWLQRADASHHTRPTPYLDAALATREATEHGRDSREG